MNRTLRGIGIRAVILIVGLVIVGIWVASLVFDFIGAAIHFVLAIGLILIAIAAFSIAARKFKSR